MRKMWFILALVALPIAAQAPPGPPQVVAQFLGFTDTQGTQFQSMLQNLQASVGPIMQQIAAKQQSLEQALEQPQPDPAAVGTLLLAIRSLQGQVKQNLDAYHQSFQAMLTQEQKNKTQLVAMAAQVAPVIPAFAAVQLVAPSQ